MVPGDLEQVREQLVREVADAVRESLLREVTDVVRDHIESKTAAAGDALWHKGQRAMQHLRREQEQLQGQLAACAESCRDLERESARLRGGLEALMKLSLRDAFLNQPPHAGSMARPAGGATMIPASADKVAPVSANASAGGPPGWWTVGSGTVAPASAPTAPPPAALEGAPGALKFSLTLRRSDQLPLGLQVAGDGDEPFLTVEAVTANGAVEAWNRQSVEDNRDIRPGDRITAINGAESAGGMRHELAAEQRLFRLHVHRQEHEVAGSLKPVAGEGPKPTVKAKVVREQVLSERPLQPNRDAAQRPPPPPQQQQHHGAAAKVGTRSGLQSISEADDEEDKENVA